MATSLECGCRFNRSVPLLAAAHAQAGQPRPLPQHCMALGYNVVLVEDACAAMSPEHQRMAVEILAGVYCVVQSTDQVIDEIEGSGEVAAAPKLQFGLAS